MQWVHSERMGQKFIQHNEKKHITNILYKRILLHFATFNMNNQYKIWKRHIWSYRCDMYRVPYWKWTGSVNLHFSRSHLVSFSLSQSLFLFFSLVLFFNDIDNVHYTWKFDCSINISNESISLKQRFIFKFNAWFSMFHSTLFVVLVLSCPLLRPDAKPNKCISLHFNQNTLQHEKCIPSVIIRVELVNTGVQ